MKKMIIIFVVILAATAGGTGIYFGYFNKKTAVLEKQSFISPLKLSPYVSREKTRETICANPAGKPLIEVCKKEYDQVSKNDAERIDQLFTALNEAKNNKNLSDYDKLLLSQAVFASLPAKDSPSAFNFNLNSRLIGFNNIFGENVNAQEAGMSRAQYEKHLIDTLASLKENCPAEGDDAWILTVMCSEYTWINGVSQPIYSKDYGEAGGDCVFTPAGEAEAAKSAHVRSNIEIKMKNEYNFSDSLKNTSHQIACAFSCVSHKCPEPEKEKGKPVDKHINDYTEPGYVGPNLVQKLLNATYKPTDKIIDTQPAPPPVIDAPVPPPPPVVPKKPEEKPAGLICCYDVEGRNDISYYLPFSGSCEDDDVQVSFDSHCVNPLIE